MISLLLLMLFIDVVLKHEIVSQNNSSYVNGYNHIMIPITHTLIEINGTGWIVPIVFPFVIKFVLPVFAYINKNWGYCDRRTISPFLHILYCLNTKDKELMIALFWTSASSFGLNDT